MGPAGTGVGGGSPLVHGNGRAGAHVRAGTRQGRKGGRGVSDTRNSTTAGGEGGGRTLARPQGEANGALHVGASTLKVSQGNAGAQEAAQGPPRSPLPLVCGTVVGNETPPPRQVQGATLGRHRSLRARYGVGAGGQWGRGAKAREPRRWVVGGAHKHTRHRLRTHTPPLVCASGRGGQRGRKALMHRREGPGESWGSWEGGRAAHR
jgi:hypothetical protein